MTAPKKIILLVIDTLRADHLGCYGYARNTSPNIDHLAAESIVFERAFTPVSYTLPAIASMLTSKRPDSHGIGLSQDGKFSGDSDLTLAELLSDNGYSTAAFVSTVVLRKATKLDLGFDVYDDKMTAEELNRPDYTLREGRATIARALEYIKRHKENDLFILIHLMDVHGPYICPPPYDAQFVDDPFYGEKATLRVVPDNHPYSGIPAYQVLGAPGAANGDGKGFINDPRVYRARYDGCIRNCDDIVASLLNGLKVLGIYDDTLFILTADHGEALGENDIYFFHGVTVTPEQISVPLLIKPSVHHVSGPKKPATHVSTIDLMPTILAACGIDWAGLGLHGRSLQLLIENGTDPGLSHRTLLSENECQDAFIRPDGTLKLEKSSRPFRGYYAHVPEVIDQLDGSKFSWRTGKKIGVITALRKSKMLKLKRAFFIEPLSLKKLAHIAYFFVSIVLPPALKHRIMPLARRLRSRFGDPELISAQAKPHEVRLAVQTESQRPRILHALADFGADGSSRLAVDLIERLGDSYEQEILTGLLPKTPSYIGVHASEINQDAAAGAFVNHIAAFRPALLHVHYKGGVDNRWYPKIFQAAERYGGRIIETIHTPTAPCFSEAVNRYVYVSNFIRTRYGPHDNKSIVIYPGMNFENLSCFENATIMDDCIGTVYRHERERLDEYLIDPFIAIAKKRPSTGFLIAGNGVLLKPFRTAVRHEGVESQFRFTDYTSYSELARFFSRMAVFIAPILQESFDPVIPFAMFTGIPVVGYDMEALPEILGDRELLAPAGDSEALTGIIDQLLDDTQRRISIGRSNRERMVSEFTVESMAEKYRSLYAEAIAGCNIFHDGSIASPAPSSAIAAADPQMNAGTRPVARRTGLKVALFVHCFFPDHFLGTETYTLQVADNLRRMGHEPVVVSAVFQGESKQSQMVTQHVYDGIQVYSIDMNYAPASCIRETYYHEALRSVFRDLLQQIRPDLVHVTHLINHTAVLLEVADNLGLPIVGTMTDFYGFCFNCRLQAVDGSICRGPNSSRTNCIACSLKSGGRRGLRRFFKKWPRLSALGLNSISHIPMLRTYPFAVTVKDIKMRPEILAACYAKYRAVIAPSRFLREAYLKNGLPTRCFVVPYGVDLPRDPKPEKPDNQPITFGFMGQITYHKGTDLLIDAFTRIPRGSANLRIHGPEDREPEFVTHLKRSADGYPISFKGVYPFEETADILRNMDVLVIPSRWGENSPLVLLDALATHTPVIVSDAGGLTDFMEEGRNGFKFAMGSTAALAQVMQKFVREPKLVAQLSQSTKYPWTTRAMVEETLKVYAFALD